MKSLKKFNVLFLTRSNHVKGLFGFSRSGITGMIVDIRVLFTTALYLVGGKYRRNLL